MNDKKIPAAALIAELESRPAPRSYWSRAVLAAAIALVDITADGHDIKLFPADRDALEKLLLNGAKDWSHYSRGGNWHCYDEEIAAAFCSPSELKKTRNGARRPNAREDWLDVQARALYQAARLVLSAAEKLAA